MLTINNVRIWGMEDIDANAILQAERTARLHVLAGPVALMPDAHVGIGATVGSVVATTGAIIPSAVGSDIGCGMIAAETSLVANDLPDSLQPLIGQFSRSIPSGVGRGRDRKRTGQSDVMAQKTAEKWMSEHPHDLGDTRDTALDQLGSLGSGNHFVEVCLDELDHVWVILHSGSRNIGNRLAFKHIALAKKQEQGLEDPDLSYFLETQPEFHNYISDMLWSQSYALENRRLMMLTALDDLFALVRFGKELSRIQCHHNFAVREIHNGFPMWITRKGAIRAQKGDLGIIPGSMGTGSYIVGGLGNSDSYNSASHGAGRRMSRGQAKRELTQESLTDLMMGKAWNQDAKGLLDEHPMAYKDLSNVMMAQEDLVEVKHKLTQVLNYKGI